jgi:anti-anti-sigma factor
MKGNYMEIKLEVGKEFSELSGTTADRFADELIRLEDSDFEEIILDFSGTESINSMSMGTIYATHQKLAAQDRKLTMINVNERIKRLFKLANLSGIIEE